MTTLDATAEAFRANPCYQTARAYGLVAAEYAEDDMIERIELASILLELESWLKGTAQ